MSRIHCEVYGQGRPLVMLHGWAMHSGVWRSFAQRLGQRYRVVCLDLPGHGRSSALDEFGLESVSRALLQAVPEQRFSLLGWSLGATFAMAMAERSPERVDKLLVLAGNPCFVESDEWPGVKEGVLDGFADLLQKDVQQTLLRFLALQVNGLAHGKQLLQALKQAVQECSPPSAEVLRAGLNVLKTSDLRAFMLGAQVPVSVLLGERDTLIPPAYGQLLQRLNPAIELAVLQGAGHAPFLSHPEPLAATVEVMLNPAADG